MAANSGEIVLLQGYAKTGVVAADQLLITQGYLVSALPPDIGTRSAGALRTTRTAGRLDTTQTAGALRTTRTVGRG